jgi:hypothetical protein
MTDMPLPSAAPPAATRLDDPADDAAVRGTRRWLETAVLGLNLCPFARTPAREGRIRIARSDAVDVDALLADLQAELERLRDTDPSELETTLLVHPRVLGDFLDFNDFLEVAEALLRALDLEGEIQIASFHPDFQFADSAAADIANATNRSPFPTLHLLREDSIEQVLAQVADPDAIYQRNIDSLRRLGQSGWDELARCWRDRLD